MDGRLTQHIRGAARTGKSRHGVQTVLGDAGFGSWLSQKRWAEARFAEKKGEHHE